MLSRYGEQHTGDHVALRRVPHASWLQVLKKEIVVEDDDVECTMIERRVLELSSGCDFLTKLVATFQVRYVRHWRSNSC